MHELGQVLGHPFGERGDQSAVPRLGGLAAFIDAILHLIFGRADFNGRVDEARRADDLFGKDAACLFHFPIAGGRGDIGCLRAHRLPLVEA